MNTTTSISTPSTMISSQEDRKTKLLTFNGNRKIQFLPIKIYQTFPDLKEIDANECSVREISVENFRHLKQLMKLTLRGNDLEKIPRNSFEDLFSLEVLDLRKAFLGSMLLSFEHFSLKATTTSNTSTALPSTTS
jgi:Leucine-rich repeat (LRR) protein